MLANPLIESEKSDNSNYVPDSNGTCNSSNGSKCICCVELWLLWTFFAIFWIFLLIVFFVGLIGGPSIAVSFSFEPLIVICVAIITMVKDRHSCCNKTTKDEQPKQEQQRSWGSGRLAWIDNVKVLLISMVVVGHSGMAFSGSGAYIGFNGPGGMNGSALQTANWYAPALWAGLSLLKPVVVPNFFLISGYFSAAGLAKKGVGKFLCGSLRRLGPPWLLFFLAINPLNAFVGYVLTQPSASEYHYFPGSSATWFLSWLLAFNCGYALFSQHKCGHKDGDTQQNDEEQQHGLAKSTSLPPSPAAATPQPSPSPSRPPSFARLVIIGLITALIQLAAGILCLVARSPLGFGNMPMSSPGDGFFNVLFYSAGVLCRKRGWFAHPTPPSLLRLSLGYVVVSWVLVILGAILAFGPGMPGSKIDITTRLFGWMGVSQLLLGPYGCATAVCLFSLFRRCCRCKNAFVSFLAGGAFAVYLLQYWAITFAIYSVAVYLRRVEGVDVVFVNSTQSDAEIGIENVYLGFLYVSMSSLVVCFVLGGVLKKIPLIGDVL